MANLLSGLKAEDYKKAFNEDDSHEDDDDADKMISRRISMNKDNKIGTDFESHLIEGQPKQAVKNEIENMFNEYRESEDKQHAKEEVEKFVINTASLDISSSVYF
jgi:hypothetical protein